MQMKAYTLHIYHTVKPRIEAPGLSYFNDSYRKTSDRLLSVQVTSTPSLYAGPSIYAGPSFYQNMSKSSIFYLFCGMRPLG